MTQPLDKASLVRSAWLTELRRQGHRQCADFYHGPNAMVCALGLLAEVARVVVHDTGPTADRVGALAGLSHEQSYDVASRNDGGEYHDDEDGMFRAYHKHTFAEIADVVEGWFK